MKIRNPLLLALLSLALAGCIGVALAAAFNATTVNATKLVPHATKPDNCGTGVPCVWSKSTTPPQLHHWDGTSDHDISTGGGGGSTDLPTAYTNSTAPVLITESNTNQGIQVKADSNGDPLMSYLTSGGTDEIDVTVSAGNLSLVGKNNAKLDFSASANTFDTSSGTVTLNGATNLASGKNFTFGSGSLLGTYTLGGTPSLGASIAGTSGSAITLTAANVTSVFHISNGTPTVAIGPLLGTAPNGATAAFDTGSTNEAGLITVHAGTDAPGTTGSDPNNDIFRVTLSTACPHKPAGLFFPADDTEAGKWNGFSVNSSRKIRQIDAQNWAGTLPSGQTYSSGNTRTYIYMLHCY